MDVAPVSQSKFRSAVRSLNEGELRAFVAELYTARGFSVDRRGGRLTVQSDNETHVVEFSDPGLLGLGRRDDPADADVVVTTREGGWRSPRLGPDQVRLGPEDLREMVLYSVSPETGDRLVQAHLGIDTRGYAAAEPSGGRRPVPVAALQTLAVVVVALAVVVGVVGPATITDALSGDGSDSSPTFPTTANETTTGTTTGPTTRNRRVGTDFSGTPGLSVRGEYGAERLAGQHAAAARATSYRLTLTFENVTDLLGRTWDRGEWTVVVEEPGTYYGSTRGLLGYTRPGRYPIVDQESYANGSTRYRRYVSAREVVYNRRPLDATRPVATVSADYVAAYLTNASVEGPRERNGTDVYRFTSSTPPSFWDGATNYTATAVVTADGLVRELHVEFVNPESSFDETARITMRVNTQATTVAVPDWYPEAREATGSR